MLLRLVWPVIFLCIALSFLSLESKIIFPRIELSLPQKPLVILITSFNNARWYDKNISSVLDQKYDNYRVVYIDDASTDGTGDLIEHYIKKHPKGHRVQLIRNTENKGQMANNFFVAHSCADHEIIVHVDGDDYLAHEHVFNMVNYAYSTENIWITFGVAQQWGLENTVWPVSALWGRHSFIVKNHAFRDEAWVYGHLRSFQAWLFKKIKIQDLMYQGTMKAFTPCSDVGFMLPMLEMAGTHVAFILTVMYQWNKANELSQYRLSIDAVRRMTALVQSWEKYQPLTPEDLIIPLKDPITDVLFFSEDVVSLEKDLRTLLKQSEVIGTIAVFFKIRHPQQKQLLKALQTRFPKIIFIPYQTRLSFAKLRSLLEEGRGQYIFYSNASPMPESVDLTWSMAMLEKTDAQGFYFMIDQAYLRERGIPLAHLEPYKKLIAWHATAEQLGTDRLRVALYKKQVIKDYFASFKTKSPRTLPIHLKGREVGISRS